MMLFVIWLLGNFITRAVFLNSLFIFLKYFFVIFLISIQYLQAMDLNQEVVNLISRLLSPFQGKSSALLVFSCY